MIEDPFGRIDYDEQGSGPTILFVPGSWSTRSAWRGVITPLADQMRIVTTSLLGYGGTEERRTAADSSINWEVDAVEAVIRRANSAVHLVGHSYGGTVCLALALRRLAPLASLTLIEATPFSLLHRCGELGLYEQVSAMREAYALSYANGDREAARRVIDFYGGDGSYDAFPARMREYIVTTTPANILDWASGMSFDEPFAAYAGIPVPTLVIRGEQGHPAVWRTSEILSRALTEASLATVAGASHFVIATHASEVARLIGEHVSKVQRPS